MPKPLSHWTKAEENRAEEPTRQKTKRHSEPMEERNVNRRNRDLKSGRRSHWKRREQKTVTESAEELPSRESYGHWSRGVSLRWQKRRAEDWTPCVYVCVVEFQSLPRSPVSCTCACAIYIHTCARGSVSSHADKNHILKSCHFETAPKSYPNPR